MNKFVKILLTIVLVIIGMIVNAAFVEANGGHGPGLIGLAVGFGFLGAITAIWKSGKKSDDNPNDITKAK
jgi:hypothetical protein